MNGLLALYISTAFANSVWVSGHSLVKGPDSCRMTITYSSNYCRSLKDVEKFQVSKVDEIKKQTRECAAELCSEGTLEENLSERANDCKSWSFSFLNAVASPRQPAVTKFFTVSCVKDKRSAPTKHSNKSDGQQ